MYETCPACGTRTVDAPGIGPCCPNKKCDRVDDLRPESERTPVRIVTPNKPLAERLREYADWTEDSGAAALLTEAADEIEAKQHAQPCIGYGAGCMCDACVR